MVAVSDILRLIFSPLNKSTPNDASAPDAAAAADDDDNDDDVDDDDDAVVGTSGEGAIATGASAGASGVRAGCVRIIPTPCTTGSHAAQKHVWHLSQRNVAGALHLPHAGGKDTDGISAVSGEGLLS